MGFRTIPLVDLPEEVTHCFGRPVGPDGRTPHHPEDPFGTMAWRIWMYRHQVVASVDSALKGAFADLWRGFADDLTVDPTRLPSRNGTCAAGDAPSPARLR